MSTERVREMRVQTARELEARGHVDKAVAIYVKAGVPAEAARLLISKARYLDAAAIMLDALGVTPDEAGRLEGRYRAAAEKTAQCFDLGGDRETAARIRRSLGSATPAQVAGRPSMPPDALPMSAPKPSLPPVAETAPPSTPGSSQSAPSPGSTTGTSSTPPRPSTSARSEPAPSAQPSRAPRPPPPATAEKWGRAAGWRTGQVDPAATERAIAELLEQGKKNAAARVAWDAGRLEDAARWFSESGLVYESGAVLFDLGRHEQSLEALLAVPEEHKKHRLACVKIVALASKLRRFDLAIDRALTRYASAPPIEASEVETYLAIAELYAQHGFADGARRVLDQILVFDPSHDAARACLEALPLAGTASAPDAAKDGPRRSAAARPIVPPGSRALPPLPSVEEFAAEARRHAARAPTR